MIEKEDTDHQKNNFDQLYIRWESLIKKIYCNALDQKWYAWEDMHMTKYNCPKKMDKIIKGQVKFKYLLDFFFKNLVDILQDKRYEKKNDKIKERFSEILTSYGQDSQLEAKETQKMVQVLYDHMPILLPMFIHECYGDEPLDKDIVEYLKKQFQNFQDSKKMINMKPKCWTVKQLMKPYKKKIIERESKLIDKKLSKNQAKNQQVKARQDYVRSNYNKQLIQMTKCQQNKKEVNKNNCLELYRNLTEEYVHSYFPNFERKCKDNFRFKPKNITAQILRKRRLEQQIEASEKESPIITSNELNATKKNKKAQMRQNNLRKMRICQNKIINLVSDCQISNIINLSINPMQQNRNTTSNDSSATLLVNDKDQEDSIMILDPITEEKKQTAASQPEVYSPGGSRFHFWKDTHQDYVQRLSYKQSKVQRQSITEFCSDLLQKQTHRMSSFQERNSNKRGSSGSFKQEEQSLEVSERESYEQSSNDLYSDAENDKKSSRFYQDLFSD